MYVSCSAFQNSNSCRRESDLVLLVFVLRRAGKGEKRSKEEEGRRREDNGGEGRGVGVVTTNSRDSCQMKRLQASVSHLETSVKGNGTRFLP